MLHKRYRRDPVPARIALALLAAHSSPGQLVDVETTLVWLAEHRAGRRDYAEALGELRLTMQAVTTEDEDR